jgi:hypothetical protein
MRTIVEGESSKETSVDSGMPQGTVLGPIMFLCHINDLPDCVNSSVRLFFTHIVDVDAPLQVV